MSPLLKRRRGILLSERIANARLEIGIGTILCIVAVAAVARTISLSGDENARNDLRLSVLDSLYAGFVARQSDSAVVSLASAQAGLPDTLAVTGDTTLLPSLRVGGFLRDRIETVNAQLIRASHRARWVTRQGIVEPAPTFSLDAIAADGPLALGIVSSAPFIVLSPFLDRQWRGVVTSDFAQGGALVGLRGGIGLERPGESDSGGSVSSFNFRDCVTRWFPDHQMRIYCTSHSASNTGELFDLSYAQNPTGTGTEGRVSPYQAGRGDPIWLNAERHDGAAAIQPGDVLEFAGLGPSLASQSSNGVIASSQWVNGRRGYTTAASGFLGRFAEVGRDSRMQSRSDTLIRLSFHWGFTEALERSVADFRGQNAGFIDRMAVVALDILTGEVLAVAEAGGSNDQPPLSFLPMLPGSVVKPILFAAALARDSTLASFSVLHAPGRIEILDGARLRSPMGNESNGCPTVVSIATALECSSNRAAAEIVVRSLGGVRPGEESIGRDRIDRSPLVDGLARVFHINTDVRRFQGRYRRVWLPEIARPEDEAVSPSSSTISPYESRPLITGEAQTVSVDNLARYAIGAWENRWTLVALAAAYARIATGRAVDPVFWDLGGRFASSYMAPEMLESDTRGLGLIRTGLLLVARSGTARRLTSSGFLDGLPQVPELRLLAKTGTLNHGVPGSRDTVYTKSLALVVGVPRGAIPSSPLECGVSIVTYIAFRRDWRAVMRRGRESSLPNLHIDFAVEHLARHVGDRWDQLGVCR